MAFVSTWIDEALRLPIAFAQVREDALLDLAVVNRLEGRPRVLMVASGGCTAAALAASGSIASLHLVDPNPAQLALSRLKLLMLAETDSVSRLALLGHTPMPESERKLWLTRAFDQLGLPADVLGQQDYVARMGPDYAGRYEQLFLALRAKLSERLDEIEALLRLSDTSRQEELAGSETSLGQTLDAAFSSVMALPILVRLFGEEATRNPVRPFHEHFSERTRHAMRTLPAASNPFLWQVLLGRFPENTTSPWLAAEAPDQFPHITWECDFMVAVLGRMADKVDFVHLSNILDWLTPERAAETLELAWMALRPGGCVLVRQLNSSLDIPSLGRHLRWDMQAARQLHQRDRSFFYRNLHLGFAQE